MNYLDIIAFIITLVVVFLNEWVLPKLYFGVTQILVSGLKEILVILLYIYFIMSLLEFYKHHIL